MPTQDEVNKEVVELFDLMNKRFKNQSHFINLNFWITLGLYAALLALFAFTITGCSTIEVTPLTVEDRLLEPVQELELSYE